MTAIQKHGFLAPGFSFYSFFSFSCVKFFLNLSPFFEHQDFSICLVVANILKFIFWGVGGGLNWCPAAAVLPMATLDVLGELRRHPVAESGAASLPAPSARSGRAETTSRLAQSAPWCWEPISGLRPLPGMSRGRSWSRARSPERGERCS